MTSTEIKAALYDLMAKRQQIAAQAAKLEAADRGLCAEIAALGVRLQLAQESEAANAEKEKDVPST